MERKVSFWENTELIQTLSAGGVVVMPTDTVYGMVAKAENPTAVNRIYTIRKRNTDKPCIILVSKISDMEKFGIKLTNTQREALSKLWPGPVSIGFPCEGNDFAYLHRGTNSLAFRLPSSMELQLLLSATGPLIAPSANPEGLPVAGNINIAREYFGDLVDMYVDGGEVTATASKIIRLDEDGNMEVIRA